MDQIFTLIMLTLGLAAIPGPNVALIIANSMRYGTRYGLVTVAGTTTGIAIQLFVVVLGIGALLELVANILLWVKWLGVGYMIYLGWRAWFTPTEDLSTIKAKREPAFVMYRRGVILACINPKTLVFNAAFLPQFIAIDGNYAGQLLMVATVFLATVTVGDAFWALFAGALRPFMLRFQSFRNRVTGAFFIAAGIGLALSDRK